MLLLNTAVDESIEVDVEIVEDGLLFAFVLDIVQD